MLRMLVSLDSKPSRLSEQSISTLSKYLSGYLIDVVHCIPEDDDDTTESARIQTCCYYILPCFFLFDRSHKRLKFALIVMGSLITESTASPLSQNYIQYAMDRSNRINAMVSTLLLMHKDAKVQKIISLFKVEMVHI
ncbi:hypothetical protein Dsin_006859 [Dipteronia sinensis]|uniref:Uncharacterized protein n=1 Tax=Dipteronia sinensis TaxID=43782 RepID=A0AAE0AZG9_9ROSI|nr:hypothetical protein Dsin_006859 [Dipteronia sinensis]